METLSLHIQIVHHFGKEKLRRCLAIVFHDLHNSSLAYKVSVLNNASGDDLSDIQAEYEASPNCAGKISFYTEFSHLGIGIAHNLLAEKESSRYILILSTDIEFAKERPHNNIEAFLHRSEQHHRGGAFAPKLILHDGTAHTRDHGSLFGFWSRLTGHRFGNMWKNQRDTTEAAWAAGAFLLLKKSVFDSVGGFDEKFSLHRAEEDLCFRIRRAGSFIYYFPSFQFISHHGLDIPKGAEHHNSTARYFYKQLIDYLEL